MRIRAFGEKFALRRISFLEGNVVCFYEVVDVVLYEAYVGEELSDRTIVTDQIQDITPLADINSLPHRCIRAD